MIPVYVDDFHYVIPKNSIGTSFTRISLEGSIESELEVARRRGTPRRGRRVAGVAKQRG